MTESQVCVKAMRACEIRTGYRMTATEWVKLLGAMCIKLTDGQRLAIRRRDTILSYFRERLKRRVSNFN